MKFFLFLLCICLTAFSFDTYSFEQSGKDQNNVGSFLTNDTSFKFIVYGNHCTYERISDCLAHVEKWYTSLSDERKNRLKNISLSFDEQKEDVNWLKQRQLEKVRGMKDLLIQDYYYCSKASFPSLKRCNYPAIRAHIRSSYPYDADISNWGSPGVWGCFMDSLFKEHLEVNQRTLEDKILIDKTGVKTLFTGLCDSVLYNITKENGSMNVEVESLLTVSGFLSTTDNIDTAIGFSQGNYRPKKNPVILKVIPLKDNSMAASLYHYVEQVYGGEFEYLFPTNVQFRIIDIQKPPFSDDSLIKGINNYILSEGIAPVISYYITVEETPTTSTYTVVQDYDPHETDCGL